MRDVFKRVIVSHLEQKAKRLIKLKSPKIVAVTGSLGKTSTKIAIAHFLSGKYRVMFTEDSYNTEIGLPLSLFGLKTPSNLLNPLAWQKLFRQIDHITHNYPYDVVVQEVGADHPGDIARFEYLHPEIAVITAVAPVHLELFKTVENVLAEKWHLAEYSQTAIINADDERLAQKAKTIPNISTYGLTNGDAHLADIKRTSFGLNATVKLRDQSFLIKTSLVARQSLYAVVAAIAVADKLGVDQASVIERAATLQPVKGRMQLLQAKNGATILDDSYNSSPQATVAALGTLMEFQGRHIAVLGSMNELGSYAEEGHREVGRAATKADLLITIGELAQQHLADAAIKSGLSQDKVKNFTSPYVAGDYLASVIQKGDVVLVKGSQNGVFTEEVIKPILANPADASRLVRQSPEWLKKKQLQFKTVAN